MPITLDSANNGIYGTREPAACNYSHTVGAGANVLIVALGMMGYNLTYGNVTMTFNGIAMTRHGPYGWSLDADGYEGSLWLFTLANPPVGTYTIQAGYTYGQNIIMISASYGGVDSSNPFGTALGNGNEYIRITQTVTTPLNGAVFGTAMIGGYGDTEYNAGQTIQATRGWNYHSLHLFDFYGAGSNTLGYSWSGYRGCAIIVIPVNPLKALDNQVMMWM